MDSDRRIATLELLGMKNLLLCCLGSDNLGASQEVLPYLLCLVNFEFQHWLGVPNGCVWPHFITFSSRTVKLTFYH